MGCRRSQPLETARRSSDGGRRSFVICRKEEEEREDQKHLADITRTGHSLQQLEMIAQDRRHWREEVVHDLCSRSQGPN